MTTLNRMLMLEPNDNLIVKVNLIEWNARARSTLNAEDKFCAINSMIVDSKFSSRCFKCPYIMSTLCTVRSKYGRIR